MHRISSFDTVEWGVTMPYLMLRPIRALFLLQFLGMQVYRDADTGVLYVQYRAGRLRRILGGRRRRKYPSMATWS